MKKNTLINSFNNEWNELNIDNRIEIPHQAKSEVRNDIISCVNSDKAAVKK